LNGKHHPVAEATGCSIYPFKNFRQAIQNGKRLPLAKPMGPSLRGREVSLF